MILFSISMFEIFNTPHFIFGIKVLHLIILYVINIWFIKNIKYSVTKLIYSDNKAMGHAAKIFDEMIQVNINHKDWEFNIKGDTI